MIIIIMIAVRMKRRRTNDISMCDLSQLCIWSRVIIMQHLFPLGYVMWWCISLCMSHQQGWQEQKWTLDSPSDQTEMIWPPQSLLHSPVCRSVSFTSGGDWWASALCRHCRAAQCAQLPRMKEDLWMRSGSKEEVQLLRAFTGPSLQHTRCHWLARPLNTNRHMTSL